MLFIDGGPKNGTAVISFNPLALTNAPATVSLRKARVIGAGGDFLHSPASIVAARQFVIFDTNSNYRLSIDDTVTSTSITISWRGTGPTFSEEIPFMIAGEVPDARRSPTGRTPVRRRARKRGRARKA
jgi:hypothetical protein